MNICRFQSPAWLLLLLALALPATCFAQLPFVEDSRLGVDVVRLHSGERIYGFLMPESSAEQVVVAVERKWLRRTYAQLADRWEERASEATESSRDQLIERIDAWMKQRKEDEFLIRFLKAERDRIEQLEDDANEPPPESTFCLVRLSSDLVRQKRTARADLRHVAGLAYQHKLSDVITTPASILARELERQGVTIKDEQVDLRDQLPTANDDSGKQWAARQALCEYHWREELDYQGTGEFLIRSGEEPADMKALIGQMLGGGLGGGLGGMDMISQLGADLGLPEFGGMKNKKTNPAWRDKVTDEAEKDGFRGVLVKRLDQSLMSPNVSVTVTFLARSDSGEWFTVFEEVVSASVNSQSKDEIDRIKNDPQVKGLLDTLSGLGLSGSDQLETALRHGAATQNAVAGATSSFQAFLAKHVHSLTESTIPLRN